MNVSPHLQFSARSFAQLIFRSQNVDLIDAKVDSLCCGNAAGGRGASSDGARIDLLECLADVFVGGVLYTRVALAMDFNPFDG